MPDNAGLTILLIEDNDDHAELVRRAFVRSRDDINLVRAASCSEGTVILKDITATLIICDYLLPDGDGLSLYKHQLKEKYPDVPVVLLTSQGDELIAVDALKSGMTDYIVKSDEALLSLPDLCRSIIREKGQKLEKIKFVNALIESEQRYRNILHAAIDGFWLVDTHNRLIEVNNSYCIMSGYSEQELLTMSISDLEAVHTVDDVFTQIQKVIEKGEARFASRHRRKDGTIFDVEVSVKYHPADGEKMVVFLRDITERKQSEDNLIQSNEQLQFVLEGSQLGFWDWNMETGEVIRNNQWAEMLGYTLDEIDFSTNQWTDLIHIEDQERAWKSINDHIEGRTPLHKVEYRMLAKDGQYRWILDQAKIVKYNNEGKPVRMSGTHTDITDRKRAEDEKLAFEQQFQHSQKLESLGVLAGGIAHDFNNILAIIIGNCSLAQMDPNKSETYIPEIEQAAERAAGLCRQMLAYAGKAQFVQNSVNIEALVAETVKMLKTTLPPNAVIKIENVPQIPLITADASQISQVAMNLIINAAEAIGEAQGEVRVYLAKTVVKDNHSEKDCLGKAIHSGYYVCLEVTDTGCGMDEETVQRIFEPFFTTKFTGRGLGMSAVLGIITAHKGAMQLFSKPGHGSTFKVYFPAQSSDSTEDDNQRSSTSLPLWQGKGTILLVDDEVQIRHFAKTLLENFGFTVIEASNGKEALDLYQQHATDIALVLTDMGMPVMDGYELFAELKQLNHNLPIIVSSGFGDAEVSSRLASENVAGIISKPYKPSQLMEVLKSALENMNYSQA